MNTARHWTCDFEKSLLRACSSSYLPAQLCPHPLAPGQRLSAPVPRQRSDESQAAPVLVPGIRLPTRRGRLREVHDADTDARRSGAVDDDRMDPLRACWTALDTNSETIRAPSSAKSSSPQAASATRTRRRAVAALSGPRGSVSLYPGCPVGQALVVGCGMSVCFLRSVKPRGRSRGRRGAVRSGNRAGVIARRSQPGGQGGATLDTEGGHHDEH